MPQLEMFKTEFDKKNETHLGANLNTSWRPANSSDLDFVIQIYNDCVKFEHGQFPLNKDAVAQFNNNPVRVVLSNPVRGHSEVHYFIVESGGDRVGVVCNLRNPDLKIEEIGLLLISSGRAKGIGTNVLQKFIEFRKSAALKITGVVAKSNRPCQVISMRSGGVIVGESKLFLLGHEIDVVHFVFHG